MRRTSNSRASIRPDQPVTLRLPDGRVLAVAVPGEHTAVDRDGSVLLLPPALRLLDQLQSVFTPITRPPSPAFLATLRRALNLTQSQFGEKAGVDKMTVSRWERGELKPGPRSLQKIEQLRKAATRKGIAISV